MANKTITQLSAVASVADIDEFEVQVSGELVTKKCTRKQLTQIEETARIAQDNVIEAGAGLNTNGTMPSLPNSYYLKNADFVTGFTDSGGANANVTPNIVNAVRALDAKLYASTAQLASSIKTIAVNCTVPDILAFNVAPKQLLAASAGYVHEIISAVAVRLGDEYGATAYEAGTDKLVIRYMGGGSDMFEFPNAFLETSADAASVGVKTANQTLSIGEGMEMYCATSPAGGTGVFTINITYRTHIAVL